ncbi:MAG: hypothetical protein EAZ53_00070 [Bacteroidetes bacterium]|nr:MAG: hypothetical protein EAZ53_00070 [Bacteroidota bacterium]
MISLIIRLNIFIVCDKLDVYQIVLRLQRKVKISVRAKKINFQKPKIKLHFFELQKFQFYSKVSKKKARYLKTMRFNCFHNIIIPISR